ncbi:MAG: glycosyltransferase [Actinomycetota bacterium]
MADPTMLRVLWCVKGLGPGGAERLLVSAAMRHDRARFAIEVVYLLPWKDHLVGELEAEDVPVRCLGGRRGDPRWMVRLAREVRRADVDVVHLHSPVMAAVARIALLGRRRPVTVSTQHNLWDSFRAPTRWVNRLTLRRDRHVVAVADTVRETMGSAAEGAEVIVHGVPLDELRARVPDRAAVRADLGVPDGADLVVTVANLRSNKAYPDLLEAARRLLDRRDDVRFVAIGQGPLADELESERQRLDLGDGFRFLGFRTDAVEITSAADLFVLSSRHEGLPVAIMEALAVGIPVVSTDAGGVTSAVRDDVEGRIIPVGRPDLLADAIDEVLSDDELRARLARAAAERGPAFSIEAAVERWEEIYETVAAP